MANSTINGYSIYSIGQFDHTYVKTDKHSWPCWGRSSGGHIICKGQCDVSISHCLSQPNSHAGILYSITGVCHQTSNRILFPARKIVSRARGYRYSSFLWQTYGRGTWKELKNCWPIIP